VTADPAGTALPPTPALPGRPSRPVWRRVLPPVLSLVLVIAVFVWFLPQFTSLSAVWSSVQAMSWVQLTVLGLAAVWNLATYQFVMVATMPGLTLRQATVETQTTTAVSNTVVGGAAIALGLTYAMATSWGFSRSRTSVCLLVSGLWNNFAKLALPVVALVLLAFSSSPSPGRVLAGVAGVLGLAAAVVLLGALLRSRAAAERIGLGAARVASALLRPFGRPPVEGWERATTKFRDRTALLLRARWHWITAATLVSHLSLFLVLLLSLRFAGVAASQVSVVEALAVFAFSRLLTAVPFTPGGLGIIELAMITGLAAAGGPRAAVAAGVLVYRALTYVLPIPIGIGTYVFWRTNRSWRRAPNTAPRTELVPEAA
jgi:putative heme transporter